ncbi:hypothetical protein VCRA2119O147_150046 [Vibrio crassostreae]|uniref:Uncharacterized protein n=1 Tax=Vibrio crassostreae TaxID=246167 RepID=A0A822N6H3_9VIBR|nr:hypothetical protein VCRA2112O187_30051 [Vibrio crassostreae]CAK2184300.1 hypothetical protein VCRA2112O191_50062 [Vibrio crassostreae]CAK2185910.1 hypothetical protein VCRA2116O234_50153 [Vibrio crassostreae]CAK2194780.1 hypothetical protein VCRA2110O135_80159 [Vibrio crassostreae]CAK2196191.1 hypothetical protein VCRA2113O138_70058 [Vibrio crassostreae]
MRSKNFMKTMFNTLLKQNFTTAKTVYAGNFVTPYQPNIH